MAFSVAVREILTSFNYAVAKTHHQRPWTQHEAEKTDTWGQKQTLHHPMVVVEFFRDAHHGTVNRSLFKLGNLISSSILETTRCFKPWRNKKSPIVGGHRSPLQPLISGHVKHTLGSPGKRIFCTAHFGSGYNFWAVNPLLRSIHSWPSKQAKHEIGRKPNHF